MIIVIICICCLFYVIAILELIMVTLSGLVQPAGIQHIGFVTLPAD